MSKKLLSEAQVRRFQSLANIEPLTEMAYEAPAKKDDEETMEEVYNKRDDEAHMKDDAMEEMAYKKHDDEDKMEALYEEEDEEDEMDAADVELDEDLVQKFIEAVDTMKEVADILGGGEGGEEEMDMGDDEPADDMDMDMGGDEPAPEAEASPEGGEEEALEEQELDEEMLEEALKGINYIPSKKEVVKTVAQRVAKRLQEAKQAQAKLDKALGKRK